MNVNDIYAYLKTIAENLLAIGHVDAGPKRFTIMEEVLDGIRAKLDTSTLLMVADAERGSITGLGQSGLVESHECAVALVRKVSPGDYTKMLLAYDDSLNAIRQMLAQMVADKKAMHPVMKALVLEGIEFKRIGPFIDNLHGYEVAFRLSSKNTCAYNINPTNWKP
jgi:hypothetical protein